MGQMAKYLGATKLIGLTGLLGLTCAQALPPLWGPERWRTATEWLHFHQAYSWSRQEAQYFSERLPVPMLTAPPSPLPPLWEAYALYDLLRAEAPQALETYAEAQGPRYRAALARFYAAKYAFLRRAYEEALQYLGELSPNAFPRTLQEEIRFITGYSAYAMGDPARALTLLRPLTEKVGPFHDPANYYVGLILYERGDWRGAAAHLEAVQTRLPYAQEAPLWLAYALAQIPDLPRLLQQAERWRTLKPAHADTLWPFVVVTLARAKECTAAETFAEEAPDHPFVQLWLGICAYQQRKDSLALQYWAPLTVREDSLGAWALYGSALALRRLGRSEEALASLRKIPLLSTAPTAEALQLTAQLAWELRLFDTGREALQQLLQLPLSPSQRKEAHRWLAEMLAALERYSEALSRLDSVPEKTEPYQRFLLLAGFRALREKNFGEAESLFARCGTAEGPYTHLGRFWQAEALYRKGDLEAAAPAYERFLRTPRSDTSRYAPEARLALAWTYLQLGRVEQSLRYSEALRTSGPTALRPYATLLAAHAFFLKKNYSAALPLYQSLLGQLPEAQVRYHIAKTLVRLERYGEAEATLAPVTPTLPAADAALYLRAEICGVWLNRPACTREAAEALLQHFPSSPWAGLARARLGLALAELNQSHLAIQQLRTVLEEYASTPEAVKLALDGLRELLPADEYDALYRSFLERLPPESETRRSIEQQRLRQLAEAQSWSQLQQEAYALQVRYPGLLAEATQWQALAAEQLKDTTAALGLYHTLTRYPEYRPQAWEKLSRLYQAQGRLAEAWAASDSLLRYLPASGFGRLQGLLSWAELAALQGAADTAIRVCQELLLDSLLSVTARQQVLLTLGLLAEKQDSPDSALAYLEKASRLEKNGLAAEALYHQARLLYQLNRWNEARTAIYRLRDELPAHIEPRAKAYLILARIFLGENKRKSARQLLESLIENAPNEAIRQEAQGLKDSLPPEPPPAPERPKKKKSSSKKK